LKVSVLCITYNHEQFIAQAIQSVLMQKTNFDYELVIGEDCSQDETREIVTSFQRRQPEKIRALLWERNLGAATNFIRTYQACQGTYVAILDGDDYWTSSHKLQKQVDFLQTHPECSGCFHSVKRVCEDNQSSRILSPRGRKRMYKFADFGAGLVANACSMMFRNNLIGKIPDWYEKSLNGDWIFQILHAEHGDIGFIDEVMAVYRIHRGGIWSGQNNSSDGLMELIKTRQLLLAHVKPRYKPLFRRYLYKRYYLLAHYFAEQGDGKQAKHYAKKCLTECGYSFHVSLTEPFKIYTHIYARPCYDLLRNIKQKFLRRPVKAW